MTSKTVDITKNLPKPAAAFARIALKATRTLAVIGIISLGTGAILARHLDSKAPNAADNTGATALFASNVCFGGRPKGLQNPPDLSDRAIACFVAAGAEMDSTITGRGASDETAERVNRRFVTPKAG